MWGSVCVIGAGGTASIAPENGAPDCSPLSKFRSSSAGVMFGTAAPAAGEPARGDGGAAGIDGALMAPPARPGESANGAAGCGVAGTGADGRVGVGGMRGWQPAGATISAPAGGGARGGGAGGLGRGGAPGVGRLRAPGYPQCGPGPATGSRFSGYRRRWSDRIRS